MSNAGPSRRDFSAACLATGLTAASWARAAGAGQRISMAVIGCGGMGTGHLGQLVKRSARDNVRVLAVCDVYQRRLTRACKISGARGFNDYRKGLQDRDIDALLIATPHHSHGKIALPPMDAGP